jgi:hypothetical protein
MVDKGKIETGVDDLVRVVGSSGKISIPDVAKKLGVEQKTVETWVDFLVEEEKLSVEYKFTTPYIFLNEDKKEDDDLSITDDDVDSEIQREETEIDTSNTEFQTFISDLTKMFHDMHKLLRDNKLDHAYRDYAKLCQLVSKIKDAEMSDVFNRNLIKLNDAMLTVLRTAQEHLPQTIQQLQQLMTQGRSALSQGNVDQAKQVYQQMKGVYDGFPSLLVTEKTRLYDYLSMFYKNIVDKERDLTESVMHDAQEKIDDVRKQVTELIKQENVDACDQYLPTLNQIYASVPADLASYRILVYNKILKIYQEIKIAKKFKDLRDQLQQIGSDISLPSMTEFIRQHVPQQVDTLEVPKPSSSNEPVFPESPENSSQQITSEQPSDSKNGPQPGKLNFDAKEVADKGFLGLMKKPEDQSNGQERKDESKTEPLKQEEIKEPSKSSKTDENATEQSEEKKPKDDFIEPTFPEVAKEEPQKVPPVSVDTASNQTNVQKESENKNVQQETQTPSESKDDTKPSESAPPMQQPEQVQVPDIPPGTVEVPPPQEIDAEDKEPVFSEPEKKEEKKEKEEKEESQEHETEPPITHLEEDLETPKHPYSTDVLPPPQLKPSDKTVGEESQEKQNVIAQATKPEELLEKPSIPSVEAEAKITSPVPLDSTEPISNEQQLPKEVQKEKELPIPQETLIKQELPSDIPEPPMPSFNRNSLSNVPTVAQREDEPQNPELLFGEDNPLDEIPPRTINKETDEGIIKEETPQLYRQYATPVLKTSQLQQKFGQDEKLKDAIDAYHKKDYFRAKELFDSVLHYDPENAKAKQMSELLKGLLADRVST